MKITLTIMKFPDGSRLLLSRLPNGLAYFSARLGDGRIAARGDRPDCMRALRTAWAGTGAGAGAFDGPAPATAPRRGDTARLPAAA